MHFLDKSNVYFSEVIGHVTCRGKPCFRSRRVKYDINLPASNIQFPSLCADVDTAMNSTLNGSNGPAMIIPMSTSFPFPTFTSCFSLPSTVSVSPQLIQNGLIWLKFDVCCWLSMVVSILAQFV